MKTKRSKIVKAITDKLKVINGNAPYTTNLFNNAYPILKFWDEVNDFPCVYAYSGTEYREYLPSNFTWAYVVVTLRVYVRAEDAQTAQEQLESVMGDVEYVLDNNRQLVYDSGSGATTTEILVTNIVTDEGLLAPYGVGEITLEVRYPAM